MQNVSLIDLAGLRDRGLQVVRHTDALGNASVRHGWGLLDMTGEAPVWLLIGSHGCVSPTQWEAVAEGLGRIAQGDYTV